MTEFVVDCELMPLAQDGRQLVLPYGTAGHVHEQIIRCRNCDYYREHKWFQSRYGLGTDIRDVCLFWGDKTGVKVAPDGFCFCAKPREQE